MKINTDLANKLIYGSYHDKLGNLDDKFRIIDNINKVNKNTNDKRILVYGKVCSFFSKDQLLYYVDFLKIKLPTNFIMIHFLGCSH